jgi:hypothetical protein
MALTPFTPPEAPAIPEPGALFGYEFRCIYLHADGEVCGHKTGEPHWFCQAHFNTPNDGNDNIVMGEPRIVPKAKGSFKRTATPSQMAAHIQWVACIRAAQVAEMQQVVQAAAADLDVQVTRMYAAQEEIRNRRLSRRLLNATRKVLS